MYRVSIDPGIEGTGLAVWNDASWDTLVPPIHVYSNIHHVGMNEGTWLTRMLSISKQVQALLDTLTVQNQKLLHVYIEWPHYRADHVGQTATAKGDIHKLSALIGSLTSLAATRYGAVVHLVPVADWKGQLPKYVVRDRILKHFGEPVCEGSLHIRQHGWDAVGIGLYAKGFKFSG